MEKNESAIRRRIAAVAGPLLLIALVILIFRHTLFSSGTLVPGWPGFDLDAVYVPWRYFGFSQWKTGHFPYWNPHVFSGLPFFAQIQSSLLYPISWANFLFNTATAANIEMGLDLAAAGICTYAWARQRRISRCGATLAGAMFLFSGAVFLYVLDGYMAVLASAAWMPLVFLAIDRLLEQRCASAILIGSAGVFLECLGGHIQLVYYTFLVGGLYLVLESLPKQQKLRMYAAFAAIWFLGGMLSSIQMLPTYCATQLSIRAGGVSYTYASMVSLPPESLLSAIVPYPLGDMKNIPYMGRWYLWEMGMYAGLAGLVLAIIRLAKMQNHQRWRMMLILAFILTMAMGSHTPLHWLLYRFCPGFSIFRGPSKFRILWVLFLAILAGEGWDHLRHGEVGMRAASITAAATLLCIGISLVIRQSNSPTGPSEQLLHWIYQTSEFGGAVKYFHDPQTLSAMRLWMAHQWIMAAIILALASALIFLRRYMIGAAYGLLALAIADVFWAAASSSPATILQRAFPQQWQKAVVTATANDQRLLFTDGIRFTNLGDVVGFNSVWGYDTGQPKIYTQLFATSQGQPNVRPEEYAFAFLRPSRILQLLRCRYVLQWSDKYPVLEVRNPMPHLALIQNYKIENDVLTTAAELNKDFDFRHAAILTSTPNPLPAPGAPQGNARLLSQSINDLEIEADLPAPALLLITDAYSPGWTVRPLETNENQNHYNVIRADDVFRVIPLAAGHHHFDLYYFPPGLRAGIALSALGVVVWATGIWMLIRKNKSKAERVNAQPINRHSKNSRDATHPGVSGIRCIPAIADRQVYGKLLNGRE